MIDIFLPPLFMLVPRTKCNDVTQKQNILGVFTITLISIENKTHNFTRNQTLKTKCQNVRIQLSFLHQHSKVLQQPDMIWIQEFFLLIHENINFQTINFRFVKRVIHANNVRIQLISQRDLFFNLHYFRTCIYVRTIVFWPRVKYLIQSLDLNFLLDSQLERNSVTSLLEIKQYLKTNSLRFY